MVRGADFSALLHARAWGIRMGPEFQNQRNGTISGCYGVKRSITKGLTIPAWYGYGRRPVTPICGNRLHGER